MSCTTMLVGKGVTNDGSTIIARNEDCENGTFNAKSMVVVKPEDQPREYTGVASHLTMKLPDDPLRYVCVPNTDKADGVWGEAGINEANVSMTATETISTNSRVLGADPLVCYDPKTGKPGGIGEENLVTIILPYIKSAREGVLRMGALLEEFGTYEMNGVAFGDVDEIWYIETVGGHHWIARRVPDDCFVAQPNRLGIDKLDLHDALGEGHDYLCSKDLAKWMAANHLDVSLPDAADASDTVDGIPAVFNPREAFSSYTWLDIVYNNPRAWYICKVMAKESDLFGGIAPKYGPESMDIPWALEPKVKVSAMDVKDILSSTYDGTPYDPYGKQGTDESRKRFRDIGINRTCECSVLQIRPNAPEASRAVQWTAFGSGPFNTAIAMFTNVEKIPQYLDTPMNVSTDSFYWTNRMVAAMADPEYFDNMEAISGYQQNTMAQGYASLAEMDAKVSGMSDADAKKALEEANESLVAKVKEQNDALLGSVLFTRSLNMKNAFGASDH
ncbi:MAG: C69 family dipeptidase [Eggerthellaceae bacterium]|nr:C69 family dipeptidase [Eggerthellaceae bacterium]